MKLTKKGEYALRAMIALARARGAAMTITQIAEQQQIPKKFLEQILLALKSAGLVTSKAGPRGGYVLAAERSEQVITAGEILNAVEEPLSQAAEVSGGKEANGEEGTPGSVSALVESIRTFIREKLQTVTLEELASQDVPSDQMEALMWYI